MSLLANSEGVSIVIPAYNYAHYLPHALASLISQTYRELEILVVDDGSTDGTRAVVEKVTDPRVRYLWQANAGLSASRNSGIREARHAFIGFLDADDAWEPDFLHRVMAEFARLPGTFGAVATAASRMDNEGKPVAASPFTFGRSGELYVRDFCLRNRPLSSNIVIRKAVFDACGGFDSSLRSSEDRDMWIRMTAAGWRFSFLDEPLARIRRHGQNMSRNAPRMKANTRRVLQKAWRTAAMPRWSPFWLKVFSIHFHQIAWTHHDDGFPLRPYGYLVISMLLWPWHGDHERLSERPLFRLRALARFLLNQLRRR